MFGLHDLGDKDRLYPSYKFPWAGNMMIHKSVFMKHGYFDTSLGRKGGELLGSEEKAFFEKVRKAGVNVYYWADLELTHLIGKDRLNDSYIRDQSVGIGSSERKRIDESPLMFTKKLLSEFLKLSGSLILAVGYLLLGRPKAARFLIQFRYWVLQGFLNFGHWTPESNHTNKP